MAGVSLAGMTTLADVLILRPFLFSDVVLDVAHEDVRRARDEILHVISIMRCYSQALAMRLSPTMSFRQGLSLSKPASQNP
jgi:hypothetical protein